MASSIVGIECLSHPEMAISQSAENANIARASLTMADSCSLTRDLVLSITQSKPFEPRCIFEYDPTKDCCSVSLSLDCPSLSLSEASQLQSEYVFLLDRSGSMEGESITALQQAVTLLIKSMPSQCRFQIIGFGSDYKSLFSKGCAAYSDETVKQALAYISKLSADMGGTELKAPLKHALTANRTEWSRNVFVITDGQVSNTDELVSLIAQHRSNTRVFSIGIGSAVDRSLCRKLARAGAGEAKFVSLDRSGDMKSSVLRQLGRAMQPVISDVKVDWGELRDLNSTACPEQPSAVFPGTRFGIYLLDCRLPEQVLAQIKSNASNKLPAQHNIDAFERIVTITARTNQSGKPALIKLRVPITASHLTYGSVISCLAARSRIAELEQRNAETRFDPSSPAPCDKQIEILAMRFGLVSRATSFLVVFENGNEAEVLEQVPEDEPQMSMLCMPAPAGMMMKCMAMPPPPPSAALSLSMSSQPSLDEDSVRGQYYHGGMR